MFCGRLRVNGMRFVIAQSRIYRNAWEVLRYKGHQVIDNHNIFIFSCRPDIVRCQISRPNYVSYILQK